MCKQDKNNVINKCLKIAIDLWSRDIRKVDESCIEYRNMIDNQVGSYNYGFIDEVLKENWDFWNEEMIKDFKKQN